MVFEREDKMLAHEATHKKAGDGGFVRPYPCNVPGCGKAFTEKRNLNAHRRTQHTEVRGVAYMHDTRGVLRSGVSGVGGRH